MESNCTILVNSCDAYEDLWQPFFVLFDHYWKNCPYNIILNTEHKKFDYEGLNIKSLNLLSQTDKDLWGKRLRETLKKIDTKYVISIFDDFFLEKDIDQELIEECIKRMDEDDKISVIYLMKLPCKSSDDSRFDNLELVGAKVNYRLNSAPAIWRKDKLLEYTGNKDTPWAWEFFGSARTYGKKDLFYCTKQENNIYCFKSELGGAIHRGKWVKSIIEPVIKEYNIDIDLSQRGIEDENKTEYKHSIGWNLKFLLTGFRMINFKVSIFLWRAIKKRIT